MSYPTSRAVVKAYVKQTMDASPSFSGSGVVTLSGRNIGLKGLKIGYERDISEEEGYYAGLMDLFDTERASGTIELETRMDDPVKVFVGKWGWFLHIQRVLRDTSNATQVTDTAIGPLKMCMAEEDGRGGFKLPLNAMLAYLTSVVS